MRRPKDAKHSGRRTQLVPTPLLRGRRAGSNAVRPSHSGRKLTVIKTTHLVQICRSDARRCGSHESIRPLSRPIMCCPRRREGDSVVEFTRTRAGANRDTTGSRQQRHGGGNEALQLTDPLQQRLVGLRQPHVC